MDWLPQTKWPAKETTMHFCDLFFDFFLGWMPDDDCSKQAHELCTKYEMDW